MKVEIVSIDGINGKIRVFSSTGIQEIKIQKKAEGIVDGLAWLETHCDEQGFDILDAKALNYGHNFYLVKK